MPRRGALRAFIWLSEPLTVVPEVAVKPFWIIEPAGPPWRKLLFWKWLGNTGRKITSAIDTDKAHCYN